MKKITSRDNPQFKALLKLAQSAKERRKSGKTLIDGAHLLSSYLASGRMPEAVMVSESAEDAPEITKLLANLPAPLILANALFSALSPVENPTGILALISFPRQQSRSGSSVFVEAIQDPGNLGSILRSAAASGITEACLSKECADAWSPKVLRAGMGAHFFLSIRESCDLGGEIAKFPGKTVALTLHDAQNLFDLDLRNEVAFVIGNEGAGISPETLALCSHRARIPMPGKAESLNAAAAAAVSFFERVRQVS